MKHQLPAFLAGVAVTAMVFTCAPAIAAQIQTITASANTVNIALNGKQVAAKGESYTLANGTQVPYSLSYSGTTYLPIRKVGELVGQEIYWDGKTGTAGVGVNPVKVPAADEEKTYQEWKALWKVESSEIGGHQDYINLSCGKENRERVKNICTVNDNSTIQKMNARIDVELYKTYNAGSSFYILYKIDEDTDGNIKTGWTDICYKDLKVSNGYSKSMILKELS